MKIVLVTIMLALSMLLVSGLGLGQSLNETRYLGTNISAENIVEVANASGDFDTLVSALEVAGLAGTLSGPGPYTVFAPTDAAFNKLPSGLLADLIGNMSQRDTLKGILAYHVVPGRILASDLTNGMLLKTVQGENLNVTVENGRVMVNGANVIQPNINASNGVIHAIDAVLMPVAVAAAEGVTVVEPVAGKPVDTTPKPSPENVPSKTTQPGFEGVLAVAGILAVALLGLRRRA